MHTVTKRDQERLVEAGFMWNPKKRSWRHGVAAVWFVPGAKPWRSTTSVEVDALGDVGFSVAHNEVGSAISHALGGH